MLIVSNIFLRQKALTPIIAGTISGTCIGVAWLIALIVILLKRYRRKKYYKEVGKPDKDAELNDKGEFIVPPDPAILEGSHMPGERVIIEKKQRWWKFWHRGNPKSRIEEKGKEKGKGKEVAPPKLVSVPPPEPSNEPADGYSSQNTSTQDYQTGAIGERDPVSHPPLNRLATIMSVPEAPSVSEPANGDAGERDDVKDVDFVTSDNSPTPPNADPNNTQIHFYPPSTG